MATGLYKGFSSHQFEHNKSFKLLDVELVKRDLMNHIFTRFGERVYMSNFGTRIPDILFEPLDDTTLDIIESDLIAVFEYDPRVELVEMEIIPKYDEKTVFVRARLNYIELNLNDIFDIRIDFEQ